MLWYRGRNGGNGDSLVTFGKFVFILSDTLYKRRVGGTCTIALRPCLCVCVQYHCCLLCLCAGMTVNVIQQTGGNQIDQEFYVFLSAALCISLWVLIVQAKNLTTTWHIAYLLYLRMVEICQPIWSYVWAFSTRLNATRLLAILNGEDFEILCLSTLCKQTRRESAKGCLWNF